MKLKLYLCFQIALILDETPYNQFFCLVFVTNYFL